MIIIILCAIKKKRHWALSGPIKAELGLWYICQEASDPGVKWGDGSKNVLLFTGNGSQSLFFSFFSFSSICSCFLVMTPLSFEFCCSLLALLSSFLPLFPFTEVKISVLFQVIFNLCAYFCVCLLTCRSVFPSLLHIALRAIASSPPGPCSPPLQHLMGGGGGARERSLRRDQRMWSLFFFFGSFHGFLLSSFFFLAVWGFIDLCLCLFLL